MILSAIGLPVSGSSTITLPPSVADRTDGGVQAVEPASAAGGSGAAGGLGSRAGSGQQGDARSGAEMSAARSLKQRVAGPSRPPGLPAEDSEIRVGRGRLAGPERPAGPQPAFEIAVLEKLREDVMRIPPEGRSDVGDEAAAPQRSEASSRPVSESRGTDSTREPAPVARTRADESAEARRAEQPEREGPEAVDSTEQRPREPADDRFDDARRMSGDPVPRSLDLTR